MIKANPTSRVQIQLYADHIRKCIGYKNQLYFPVLKFLEIVLPTLIPNFNYEILSKEEMGNKHRETRPDLDLIQIREDVYSGACIGNGRDRMTIAHEIGHLLMHSKLNISLCRVENGIEEKPKIYEDPEWQADVFAGELLAPSYLIRDMSPEEVSKGANISLAAARTQLRHLPINHSQNPHERRRCL